MRLYFYIDIDIQVFIMSSTVIGASRVRIMVEKMMGKNIERLIGKGDERIIFLDGEYIG